LSARYGDLVAKMDRLDRELNMADADLRAEMRSGSATGRQAARERLDAVFSQWQDAARELKAARNGSGGST